MSSTVSDADTRAADYETVERRYSIAVNLESWELLAMHSIASDEVRPFVRLFVFFSQPLRGQAKKKRYTMERGGGKKEDA